MNKFEDMDRYMHYLIHTTNTVLHVCRKMFLERFPGQEQYWDIQIHDWLD